MTEFAPPVRFLAVAPEFAVRDVVRAAEYYRDVLGFEIEGFLEDPPVFALLSRDEVELHLRSGGNRSAEAEAPRGDPDAYVWVEDVDVLAAELKERGARLLEGPVDRDYGMREIRVCDLDGFILVFGSRRAPPAPPERGAGTSGD
jgi:catechol 2,3-dioxygenase-like lactoylglutathione lyase family enzyme